MVNENVLYPTEVLVLRGVFPGLVIAGFTNAGLSDPALAETWRVIELTARIRPPYYSSQLKLDFSPHTSHPRVGSRLFIRETSRREKQDEQARL